jgi:hypothetical protein
MTRLQEAIGLGLILGIVHGLLQPAYSVPVVPNFTQGSMTSHTETTSTVTETINSMDYNTGYQYSVTGSGVEPTSGIQNGQESQRHHHSNRQHQEQRFSLRKPLLDQV